MIKTFRLIAILITLLLMVGIGMIVRFQFFEKPRISQYDRDILESQITDINYSESILRSIREGKNEQAILIAESVLLLEITFVPCYAEKAGVSLNDNSISNVFNDVVAYCSDYSVFESKHASLPSHKNAYRCLDKYGYKISTNQPQEKANK